MSLFINLLIPNKSRNIIICPQCKTQFYLFSSKTTYRACDMHVCSRKCAIERVKSITEIDPDLIYPEKWLQKI